MASKSIHISDAVHAQIQVVANAQGKTVDEAGEDILREALDFKQLLGEGHAHARARGFKPSDVLPKIAEYRREKADRGR